VLKSLITLQGDCQSVVGAWHGGNHNRRKISATGLAAPQLGDSPMSKDPIFIVNEHGWYYEYHQPNGSKVVNRGLVCTDEGESYRYQGKRYNTADELIVELRRGDDLRRQSPEPKVIDCD